MAMAELELTKEELATLSWFLESAIVAQKEGLEEAEEKGLEDAFRVQDLAQLEELREIVHNRLVQVKGRDTVSTLNLTPKQLKRLDQLAEDGIALCRGQEGGMDRPTPGSDVQGLTQILEEIREKTHACPDWPMN